MLKDKKMMAVWVLLVLAVIAILVYITINHKEVPAAENNQPVADQNTNMQQPTQGQGEAQQPSSVTDGVKITVLKQGIGNAAKAGDTVAMNYTGTLSDGTVFDSNIDKKFGHVQPFIFTLGVGQVIKGWDVGVAGMKTGEKRKLVISPEFGYGATGAGGGVIPPNATLTFEVELLGIKQ